MSSKYKTSKEVPSDILCSRLNVLSNAVTLGKKEIDREFYMRVPAEVDNDADLVIAEASGRITTLQAEIDRLKSNEKEWDRICNQHLKHIAKQRKRISKMQAEVDRLNKLVNELTEKLMNYVADEDEEK